MLQQFLEQNRDTISKKWIDQTFLTYQPEMVRFLKGKKNQFANPVRNTILTSLEKIYDGILISKITDEFYPELEDIIKLRAVQDFSPSNALSFLFSFKKIVREEIEKMDEDVSSSKELQNFNDKIDALIRLSFDIYSKCRSKIYEIRINEIKSQTKRAFEIFDKQK